MGGGTLSLLMTHVQVRQNLLTIKSFVEFIHKYKPGDIAICYMEQRHNCSMEKFLQSLKSMNQARLCYIFVSQAWGKGEGGREQRERRRRGGGKTTVSKFANLRIIIGNALSKTCQSQIPRKLSSSHVAHGNTFDKSSQHTVISQLQCVCATSLNNAWDIKSEI